MKKLFFVGLILLFTACKPDSFSHMLAQDVIKIENKQALTVTDKDVAGFLCVVSFSERLKNMSEEEKTKLLTSAFPTIDRNKLTIEQITKWAESVVETCATEVLSYYSK